ncbi:MAG: UxaA family hydrolase [Puia sp.]
MRKLIKIHSNDNVLVACGTIQAGQEVEFQGMKIVFFQPLHLGHKIAARNILAGEKIIKFGVPIGSAIEDIPAGTHVHLHNMKSDYIPTYTLDHEFIKS